MDIKSVLSCRSDVDITNTEFTVWCWVRYFIGVVSTSRRLPPCVSDIVKSCVRARRLFTLEVTNTDYLSLLKLIFSVYYIVIPIYTWVTPIYTWVIHIYT